MAALLSELIPELTVALSDGLSVLLLFLGTFLLVAVIAGLDDWSQSRDHDLPERVYRLRAPQRPQSSVAVALDSDAWVRMNEFVNAGDRVGLAELEEAGHIALVPPETLVRRIKAVGGAAEVRFEEGPHKDRLAIVSKKVLQRTLPPKRPEEIS